MPPHLRTGLTPAAASHICMHECKAMCCRGPMYLRLTPEEVVAFKEQAAALGVALRIVLAPDGSGSVGFLDHEGERCPMLDSATWACRVYQHRPQRCRDFPERPVPGCAISGAL
jgi:Fe-S-cluster containining protein